LAGPAAVAKAKEGFLSLNTMTATSEEKCDLVDVYDQLFLELLLDCHKDSSFVAEAGEKMTGFVLDPASLESWVKLPEEADDSFLVCLETFKLLATWAEAAPEQVKRIVDRVTALSEGYNFFPPVAYQRFFAMKSVYYKVLPGILEGLENISPIPTLFVDQTTKVKDFTNFLKENEENVELAQTVFFKRSMGGGNKFNQVMQLSIQDVENEGQENILLQEDLFKKWLGIEDEFEGRNHNLLKDLADWDYLLQRKVDDGADVGGGEYKMFVLDGKCKFGVHYTSPLSDIDENAQENPPLIVYDFDPYLKASTKDIFTQKQSFVELEEICKAAEEVVARLKEHKEADGSQFFLRVDMLRTQDRLYVLELEYFGEAFIEFFSFANTEAKTIAWKHLKDAVKKWLAHFAQQQNKNKKQKQ
jgi:hypothetical protein